MYPIFNILLWYGIYLLCHIGKGIIKKIFFFHGYNIVMYNVVIKGIYELKSVFYFKFFN